jgi:hypothetical protein
MPSAYTYVYLVGSLLFVPIWALWYWRSPSSRREMLLMSGIFICIGVPSEALLYTRDWWHPATVTGTLIGVEDVLYSIGNGGYMAALYAVITRGQLVHDRQAPAWPQRLAPIAAMATLPFVLCLGFGVHSFVATSIGSLVALAIVLAYRTDLTRVPWSVASSAPPWRSRSMSPSRRCSPVRSPRRGTSPTCRAFCRWASRSKICCGTCTRRPCGARTTSLPAARAS